MLKECKNSKKQGDVGLGSAISYFTSLGWTVLIPLTDSQDYDLVVDDGNKLSKIQVKTTYCKAPSGSFICNLRLMGGNRKENIIAKRASEIKYDILFILTNDGGKYIIPKRDISDKNTVTLGVDYNKYKI